MKETGRRIKPIKEKVFNKRLGRLDVKKIKANLNIAKAFHNLFLRSLNFGTLLGTDMNQERCDKGHGFPH